MEENTGKKSKINTKTVIILIVAMTVVCAILMVVINVIKAKYDNKSGDGNTAEAYYREVSDTISGMVGAADLKIQYFVSDQRTVLYLVGSQKYYILQYTSSTHLMHVLDGTYTSTGLTDEQRVKEALEKTSANEKLFSGIAEFSVDNANSNGEFTDGKIEFTLGVEIPSFKRDMFSVAIPSK